MTMKSVFSRAIGATVLCAALATAIPAVAEPDRPRKRDQDAAFDQTREGRIRPLREIERGVLPRMSGAHYLGPELDSGSGVYRLKFMRGGSVIWIDVDGRTGAIIRRSGD